jgi:hypothetical protein
VPAAVQLRAAHYRGVRDAQRVQSHLTLSRSPYRWRGDPLQWPANGWISKNNKQKGHESAG